MNDEEQEWQESNLKRTLDHMAKPRAGDLTSGKPDDPVGSSDLVALWRVLLKTTRSKRLDISRDSIMEAIERITEMERALKVISVWAECGIGSLEDPEDALDDIARKCKQTLNHFSATDEVSRRDGGKRAENEIETQ